MAKLNEIYKCEICGNIVELVHVGGGILVCCGQNMKLLEEKSEDPEKGEKHVPVVEKKDGKVIVKVGAVGHPMEPEHFIEWIEILVNGKVYRQQLKPGDKPEAEFEISLGGGEIIAREYCNLHGLWRK